jgi:Xaa-Pro aminopeptidase
MSEREIAFDLENEMRKLGADRCAFSPIVGVGARAALPHARLTHRTVGESPFVLVDWGAFVDGYASDLTRTLVTGEPPAEFLKIYDVVLRAQQAAIDLIRPGADLQTVDSAARNLIEDEGYGDFFGHGLGHGFGLMVHEQPFMTPTRKGTFSEGMVVTVEPGIYLPNVAGVRIEDDILVTADGHESLSTLPRDIESQFVALS